MDRDDAAHPLEPARRRPDASSSPATFDPLTGLASRAELQRRLENLWLPWGTRRMTLLAILFFDIDGFGHLAQEYGPEAGDEILATIAHRMRIRSRAGDLVARYEGDTFVVVLGRVTSLREAQGASDRIRLAQLEPIAIGFQSVSVSMSVGIAVAADGEHPLVTLRRAERTMHRSRESRRSG